MFNSLTKSTIFDNIKFFIGFEFIYSNSCGILIESDKM